MKGQRAKIPTVKRAPRPHAKMTEAQTMDKIMARIERRARDNDYIKTAEAVKAKQASETKGRYGRGESALDQFVVHGIIATDRQYHRFKNVRDNIDNGDVDA